MTGRDGIVFMAKLAEQAERYEDMAQNMKELVNGGAELNVEERNLLSVAYKNRIGARRASWRVVAACEDKISENNKTYIKEIEDELHEICDEILTLLEELIPKATSGTDPVKAAEAKVFFLKMKGDYWRYKAEIAKDTEESKFTKENAHQAYEAAKKEAEEHLDSTSPIRLGLFLNFSVFYFELLNKPEKACETAKEAFDRAIADLDTLNEDSYKDSTLIMQLLRDNLTLWTTNLEADQDCTKVEDLEETK